MSDDVVSYFRRPQACEYPGCRSKLFYEQDGFVYCKREGHQQEGVAIAAEEGEGVHADRIRIQRDRDDREFSSRQTIALSGAPALLLYLKCYQMILWHQCHALMSRERLPADLERLVKHLWTLRVSLLQPRLARMKARGAAAPEQTFTAMASQQVNEAAEAEQDATAPDPNSAAAQIHADSSPTLIQSLALVYIAAAVLLRLPLTLGRFLQLVNQDTVPYIRAVRHIPLVMKQRLPYHLYSPLASHLGHLAAEKLRNTVRKLIRFYRVQFGSAAEMTADKLIIPQSLDEPPAFFAVPPLNMPPMLYRLLYDLALPVPWLWPGVYKFAANLQLEFVYAEPRLVDLPPDERTLALRRQNPTRDPDLMLAAVIVIVTKLLMPLPKPAQESEQGDSSKTWRTFDWREWVAALQRHEQRLLDCAEDTLNGDAEFDMFIPDDAANGVEGGKKSWRRQVPLARGAESFVTPAMAMNMSPIQLDSFLSWYERIWIEEDEALANLARDNVSQEMLDLFPVGHQQHNSNEGEGDETQMSVDGIDQPDRQPGDVNFETREVEAAATSQERRISEVMRRCLLPSRSDQATGQQEYLDFMQQLEEQFEEYQKSREEGYDPNLDPDADDKTSAPRPARGYLKSKSGGTTYQIFPDVAELYACEGENAASSNNDPDEMINETGQYKEDKDQIYRRPYRYQHPTIVFHNQVAQIIGCPLPSLLWTVRRLETQLFVHERAQRHRFVPAEPSAPARQYRQRKREIKMILDPTPPPEPKIKRFRTMAKGKGRKVSKGIRDARKKTRKSRTKKKKHPQKNPDPEPDEESEVEDPQDKVRKNARPIGPKRARGRPRTRPIPPPKRPRLPTPERKEFNRLKANAWAREHYAKTKAKGRVRLTTPEREEQKAAKIAAKEEEKRLARHAREEEKRLVREAAEVEAHGRLRTASEVREEKRLAKNALQRRRDQRKKARKSGQAGAGEGGAGQAATEGGLGAEGVAGAEREADADKQTRGQAAGADGDANAEGAVPTEQEGATQTKPRGRRRMTTPEREAKRAAANAAARERYRLAKLAKSGPTGAGQVVAGESEAGRVGTREPEADADGDVDAEGEPDSDDFSAAAPSSTQSQKPRASPRKKTDAQSNASNATVTGLEPTTAPSTFRKRKRAAEDTIDAQSKDIPFKKASTSKKPSTTSKKKKDKDKTDATAAESATEADSPTDTRPSASQRSEYSQTDARSSECPP